MNDGDKKPKRGRPEERLKIKEEPEEALQKLSRPKGEAMARWTKDTPGPGVYRCRGPYIYDVPEIIVEVAYHGEGLTKGLEPRVISPDQYAKRPMPIRSFRHSILKDAEWTPHEAERTATA